MHDSPKHLARITPVDAGQSPGILSLPSVLLHSLLLVSFQVGWVALIFAGLLLFDVHQLLGVSCVVLACYWLLMQFVLVFVYPEWPLNRLLAWRLSNSVQRRVNPLVSARDNHLRVVELVPRERWRKLSLETATDLMLMEVNDDCVLMSGDRYDYRLSGESILGVELHSITPPGWFTATHMVILYVRSDQGQIELPISYRDHGLGSLRSSTRRAHAMELVEQISSIAKGHLYQAPSGPVTGVIGEPAPWSGNPYASPAILDES